MEVSSSRRDAQSPQQRTAVHDEGQAQLVEQSPSTKDDLRESVREMGYEEGAQALKPASGDKEPTPQEKQEALQKSYEEALGEYLGGELYEVVSEEVSQEAVNDLASQAVKELIEAVGDAYEDLHPGEKGKKDAAAIVKEWNGVLQNYLAEYAESEQGRALIARVTDYVQENPGKVLAAVFLAAVAANMKIPRVKKKIQLAEGLQAMIGVRLGSMREVTLQTISAGLKYESGRFKGDASVEHKTEDETTRGTVKASYGDKGRTVSTSATVDDKGLLKARLGAAFKGDGTTGSAGVSHDRKAGTAVDATVSYGDKQRKESGSAKYNVDTGALSVKLSREIQQDLRYKVSQSFEKSGDNTRTGMEFGVGKGALDFTVGHEEDTSGKAATKLGAKYAPRDLTLALDATFGSEGDTIGTSIKAHPESGLLYGGDVRFSLDDSRVLNYGVHFGFRDPDEFKGFLLDYHHNAKPDVPEDRFKASVEYTVDQLMLRGTSDTKLRGGCLSMGQLGLHGAYPVKDDIALIGGVVQGYGPDRTVSTRPELGVQVGKIPVLIGYDPNSKAWSLRLTIPFGR